LLVRVLDVFLVEPERVRCAGTSTTRAARGAGTADRARRDRDGAATC